jgi:hypothetical protein
VAEFQYERPWLYAKQTEALFGPARYAFVEASTKSGKTVGCIAWIFEQAAINGKPGRNYWWVAPTLPVAKIAYRRIKRAIPRHLYKFNDTDSYITLINGAVIWFKGSDKPDSLYGEDVYAAVVDEASRCKEDAWIALRSTLTATKGPVRVIGNVKGKHNWAYRLARKAEQGVMRDAAYFRLTANDAIEAGIFSNSEVEEAKQHMPESAWKELYYAEAADDGSNPFGWDAINDCTVELAAWEQDLKDHPSDTMCYGADFGRAQDYTVAIGLDKHYRVTRWDRFQRPWRETRQDVMRLVGAIPVWGDSTGVGDSVVEELQRDGCPVIGVPFSQPMKQKLMEELRSAIQQRKLRIPKGVITDELESFEYTYIGGDQGRVRYSAPEGLHDDCVMSLALAVHGRNQFGSWQEPEPVMVPQGRHPGFDFENKKRRERWEEPVPEGKWVQSKETVKLSDW